MRKGFSLIEVLIVITIIGILASVIMSSVLVGREKAQIAKAQLYVGQLRRAIALLAMDTGQWPGHKTEDDVESGSSGNEMFDLSIPEAGLVSTDGNFPGWDGPYIGAITSDPWGNDYYFDTDYDIDETSGETWAAVVGSFGPNGVGQNVYDEDNIYKTIVSE